jgi:hypothetical protein
MSETTAPLNLGKRVTAALDFIETTNDYAVRDHYLWELKQVMASMPPDQLSTATIISLLAVLVPEHARFLAGRKPVPGPVLWLLPRHRD